MDVSGFIGRWPVYWQLAGAGPRTGTPGLGSGPAVTLYDMWTGTRRSTRIASSTVPQISSTYRITSGMPMPRVEPGIRNSGHVGYRWRAWLAVVMRPGAATTRRAGPSWDSVSRCRGRSPRRGPCPPRPRRGRPP
jgi:hypothetical protein